MAGYPYRSKANLWFPRSIIYIEEINPTYMMHVLFPRWSLNQIQTATDVA